MQNLATFDGTVGQDISVDRETRGIGGVLRDMFLATCGRLRQILSNSSDHNPVAKPAAMQDYYAGAHERVMAGEPITSFRGLI